jgi:hypothetical protein
VLVLVIGNVPGNRRTRPFLHTSVGGRKEQICIDALRRGFSIAGTLLSGLREKAPDRCYQFTFFIFS